MHLVKLEPRTGAHPVWVNAETVTHVTVDQDGGVLLHFIGGGAITVKGDPAGVLGELVSLPTQPSPR